MSAKRAPAQGAALALYALFLPVLAVWQWQRASSSQFPWLIKAVVLTLLLLWILFLWQLRRNIQKIRRGLVLPGSGYQWLATTLVALLPFLSSHQQRPTPVPSASLNWQAPLDAHSLVSTSSWIGSVPLALAAKRVSDSLRDQPSINPELTIAQLRQRDPLLEARLLAACGRGKAGTAMIESLPSDEQPAPRNIRPIAAYIAEIASTSLTLNYVREGGTLAIPPTWHLSDLVQSLVGLHNGRILITSSEAELLRALALSSRAKTLVVFAGPQASLDPEIAAICATVSHDLVSAELLSEIGPRIRLLRAEPDLENLDSPLDPSLRRRMIEMASYLALHPNEPVTGERLRSRVLAYAGVDASSRVLANVASALRRSLGSDERGPRLHQVSSAGLYKTHGLSCDVLDFHHLVNKAKTQSGREQRESLKSALELVASEPLASSLRGFEWFLAEGHGAQLSRDGEWAALALCDAALKEGDVELAFWSIRQGLLLDPHSDDLAEALEAIPRLREFRGDGTGAAQYQSVGASGAIAVRWALTSLTQQIRQ